MIYLTESIPRFPFTLTNAKVKPTITTATNGINLTAVTAQF
jgi:hypothetical protein